ncbi:PREDICTED: ly6/PLAUR domain-containing protein 5 [Chrysochloris asiatica]|uniref:Ly6/PLAUR domain-containing protein 5 n=1 Tax=Chrysochloris asiatica TaxID=185453 RepID=A0A9B0WY52_CHRAS|nr:PREDICTED: ly6/PLAUR domain-containing protein 5 [Chrysochloris asiatica]
MGDPRTILVCLFGAVLYLTESQALQCYNFEHTYLSPFDLSGKSLPTVSCSSRCFEAVSSLSTGYRSSVTMVKKGCWSGPSNGQMQANQDSMPPDYSMVRGCTTDLCNDNIMNHDSIPNLSPAPDPQLLSGTECYACLGTVPEDCTPDKSRRVQCHQHESVCFHGNGRITIANSSVPVYIRTCHRSSCTIMGTTSPWTHIHLQGSCCEGNLCNQGSVSQVFTSAADPSQETPTSATAPSQATPTSATAPSQATPVAVLFLIVPLLLGTIGGPLGLSS